MTNEAIQASTVAKIEKVKALLSELQLGISPEEVVNPKTGIINKVVFFTDNEKYEVDAPAEAVAPAKEDEAI